MTDNRAEGGDPDISCASFPAYTQCTVHSDDDFNDSCPTPSSSSTGGIIDVLQQLPPIAIAGIVMGALGLLICFFTIIFVIRWKRQRKAKTTAVFEPLNNEETAPEPEAKSLMQDYDGQE